MLKIDSVERPVPVKQRLRRVLSSQGFTLFETEGVTCKNRQFSIFQRFVYLENIPEDVDAVRSEIKSKVDLAKYAIFEWLDFNVIFLVYDEKCLHFITFVLREGMIEVALDTENCSELANWLSSYVETRRRIKPFTQSEYLSCIDVCLREQGVPYPGNFDGLVFTETNVPKLVVEFSKVRYNTLEKHKDNLKSEKMGNRLFKEDRNRWRILLQLSRVLSIPHLIIWWCDRNRNEFMTGHVDHVESKDGIVTSDGTISFSQLKEIILDIVSEGKYEVLSYEV